MLDALRIANIICWGAMALYMASGAWAVLIGRARYGDPMRLACFLTGVFFVLAFGRFFILDESEGVLMSIYAMAIGLAVYIIVLGRTYGRGPLLSQLRSDESDG